MKAAADAGADAVKFQLFRWADVVRDHEGRDPRFELPVEWLGELEECARDLRLDFLCTPFAPWAVPVLAPHVDAWKIGSFEAEHFRFLSELPRDRTWMVSLGMVGDSYTVGLGDGHVIYMYCVSRYPALATEAALARMRRRGGRYGFSDHTPTDVAALVAYGLGARTFEKHLQLDDQPESPDRGPWALKPAEFSEYVEALRLAAEAVHSEFVIPEAPPGRLVHGR